MKAISHLATQRIKGTASLLQCSREDAVIITSGWFSSFSSSSGLKLFNALLGSKITFLFPFFDKKHKARYFLFSIILALASIHFAESNHTNYNMGAVLTRLLEVFWTKKLDIVVIGLENRYVSSSPSGIRYSMPTSNKLQPVAPSMYIT